MRSVAGSTSTRQKSRPKIALSNELFPALTSPATTKRNGSFRFACKSCNVRTDSGAACESPASVSKAKSAVPSSARNSR